MQIGLIATVVIHVLAAVFWAGTTFGLARTAGASADQLFRPQMGAATIAVLSGGYLWSLTHAGGNGLAEQVLAVGALAALLAAGVQGALAGSALRRRRNGADDNAARKRLGRAYRMSAALLAITVLAMTSARYL